MAEPRESELHGGREDYEIHRGTLVANETATVTFAAPVVSVEVRTILTGFPINPVFITLDGSEPTSDGSGDTDKKMVEIALGDTVALDKRTKTVKLRSASASRFIVTGVR